jgi:hypothetical protein
MTTATTRLPVPPRARELLFQHAQAITEIVLVERRRGTTDLAIVIVCDGERAWSASGPRDVILRNPAIAGAIHAGALAKALERRAEHGVWALVLAPDGTYAFECDVAIGTGPALPPGTFTAPGGVS